MGKKTQKIFKKHIKSFPHSQIGKVIKKETVKSEKQHNSKIVFHLKLQNSIRETISAYTRRRPSIVPGSGCQDSWDKVASYLQILIVKVSNTTLLYLSKE